MGGGGGFMSGECPWEAGVWDFRVGMRGVAGNVAGRDGAFGGVPDRRPSGRGSPRYIGGCG